MSDIQRYAGKSQTLSANAARVSELIEAAAENVERVNSGAKVSLKDIDLVKKISANYLRECAESGMLPTVRGVASRFGVSRNALYDYSKRNPGSELSKWLEDFSDLCGELTMAAALEGTVAPVPAIFVAKSRYNWRDTISIETNSNGSALGPQTPTEDLEKYLDYVEQIDEEV